MRHRRAGQGARAFTFLLTAGALLAATPADAHLVSTGVGPFYDGALHLLLSPLDMLAILASCLLAGLQGPERGRWSIATLPAGWVAGCLVGTYAAGAIMPGDVWLAALVLAIGLLAALDLRLGGWSAIIGAAAGLAFGAENGAALVPVGVGGKVLAGIVVTVFLVTVLATAGSLAIIQRFGRVPCRVAGSWIAAAGLLTVGWAVR